MSTLITKGFGSGSQLITQGFGIQGIIHKIREISRFLSKITREISLKSNVH